MRACPYCQNEVTEETIACSKCGRAIITPNDLGMTTSKNTITEDQSTPPSKANTSMIALATSILAVILFGILIGSGELLTDDLRAPILSQAGFWALFYGIPLISFLSLGIALKGMIDRRGTSRYAFLSLFINFLVLFIMGSWHFLGLGLSGYFYICISDIAAFVILIAYIVLKLIRKPS